MLVKHNLWDLKYHFKDNELINFRDYFDYVIKDNTIIAKAKESAPYGLLFIVYKDVMEPGDGVSIQCIVENLGDAPFDFEQRGVDSSLKSKRIYPHTKELINYSGIYMAGDRQLRILAAPGEEIKFKLYGLKIVEGESNDYIYLPNINTLPEEKQPLLPPEGEYKEIQAR